DKMNYKKASSWLNSEWNPSISRKDLVMAQPADGLAEFVPNEKAKKKQ
ncbi:unnamed protein product, partial [Brachionus calyciflorus]